MDGSAEGQAGVARCRGISNAFSALTSPEKAPTEPVGQRGASFAAPPKIPEIQADPVPMRD
jgi:hypothetical protein